ncbi:MAG TPA: class I SAM-dependent methyltransferase [Gaiellaceae bacterium]|nr:class I SAM-dependent methyltransferase [Gaiellaceae bacterium]
MAQGGGGAHRPRVSRRAHRPGRLGIEPRRRRLAARSIVDRGSRGPGQTFLDVGGANGLLMESMADWAGVEPYGLEISPELAEVARRRLPRWADRIWVGNAAEWQPPHRFDVVRSSLDCVPPARRRALEREVAGWGFAIAGRAERPHPHPELAYRAFWIDAARSSP